MNHCFQSLAAALAAILVVGQPSGAARAQDVFDRLQGETLSVFDYGIKRLRNNAIQILAKLQQQGDPKAQSDVTFDPETRQIRVNFIVPVNAANVSQTACWERRHNAIRELFFIGSTSYPIPISNEQRIVRRLGAMFTKEPIQIGTLVQATGERLSELTRVRMTIPMSGSPAPIVCESRVSDLRTK